MLLAPDANPIGFCHKKSVGDKQDMTIEPVAV
jgi:hypothetical protein